MKVGAVIPSRDSRLLHLCTDAHAMFTDLDASILGEGRVQFFVTLTNAAPETERYSHWNHRGAQDAQEADCDILLFQNDDTVVTPNWLDTMLEDMTALKRAGKRPGLLGACSNVCASGPQLSVGEGGIHRNGIFYSKGAAGIEAARFNGPIAYPRVVTQFAMVETAAYFDAGGFDLDLPSHAWADMILSYRLLRAGYTNAISRAFVCHFGSRTLQTIDQRADFEAGRAYCREKYPGLEKALLIPEEGA